MSLFQLDPVRANRLSPQTNALSCLSPAPRQGGGCLGQMPPTMVRQPCLAARVARGFADAAALFGHARREV